MSEMWKQQEILFDILENSLDDSYIFMCDLRSGRFRWSKDAVEYFNVPQDSLMVMQNGTIPWVRYIHPDDRHIFEDEFQKMLEGKTDVHNCEYRVLNRYGAYIWLRCKGRVLRDESGKPVFFAGAMTNLGHIGKYDATTNLKNIYEFRSNLTRWTYQAEGAKTRVGVMMIGINSFGHINEKHTYLFGNQVLRSFGKQLRQAKPDGMELYRMDGDKFACLWPGASEADLVECFSKFQDIAQHAVVVDGEDIPFSISGGALFYPDDGNDSEMIHRNLEYAMHQAKKNKKGTLEFFSGEVMEESLREIEMMDDLMSCIQDHYRGFYLCYQPIIDNRTGKLYSCEALLRWTDKTGRKVSPMEFIPLLESSGRIVEVGNWILETGIRQLSEWQKILPDMYMNINVSYLQFQREEFMQYVMNVLEKYHVSPDCLILELTETCKIMDMEGLRTEFEFFRNHGVKVALDDFGTGYASVSALKELPIDSVKIDHGFVSQLTQNQSDRHIIEYLISLIQKLGIEVCVEGIETAAIRNIVQSFQPDSLQGYFFSYPLEADLFYKQFVVQN